MNTSAFANCDSRWGRSSKSAKHTQIKESEDWKLILNSVQVRQLMMIMVQGIQQKSMPAEVDPGAELFLLVSPRTAESPGGNAQRPRASGVGLLIVPPSCAVPHATVVALSVHDVARTQQTQME